MSRKVPAGYVGKVLRVDLSHGKYIIEELNPELVEKFIGGRGFAIKILFDEVPSRVDPLSPENKIIIATGPLTGTPVVSSGKTVLATKSPLTYGYGDGNVGHTPC